MLAADTAVQLSQASRTTAGIALLAVVAIESGGWYLTRVARGTIPLTPFQHGFHRAGHAHAGVLVTLGLVCTILVDATDLTGAAAALARSGVLGAAILMPAGFFFSSLGRGATRPNNFIWLLWAGALLLAAGVVALGLGLLTT